MKTITVEEIDEILQKILKAEMSFEEADRLGWELIQLEDDYMLDYQPPNAEEKIWNAIKYMYGLDLPDLEGEYLHNLQDVQVFYDEWKKS